jgi:hypothetical protein
MLPSGPAHRKPALGVAGISQDKRHYWCGHVDFETCCFLAHEFSLFLRWSWSGSSFALVSCVFEDPALGPLGEALTESALGVRAKTGMAGMGDPPSKPGMCDTKLSRTCREYNEN